LWDPSSQFEGAEHFKILLASFKEPKVLVAVDKLEGPGANLGSAIKLRRGHLHPTRKNALK